MKTISQLLSDLKELVESKEVTLKEFSDSSGSVFVRMLLSHMPAFPDFATPTLVAPKFDGESSEYSMVRTLLLTYLDLDALTVSYKLSDKLIQFLNDANEVSQYFYPCTERKFAEFANPDNTTIEVYFLDIREAMQKGLENEAARFAMIPKVENIGQFDEAGLFKLAGYVSVPKNLGAGALESAWEKTQNLDAPWHSLDNAISLGGNQRSSMTGDVFVLDGKPHLVAMVGFREIEKFSKCVREEGKKAQKSHDYEAGPGF